MNATWHTTTLQQIVLLKCTARKLGNKMAVKASKKKKKVTTFSKVTLQTGSNNSMASALFGWKGWCFHFIWTDSIYSDINHKAGKKYIYKYITVTYQAFEIWIYRFYRMWRHVNTTYKWMRPLCYVDIFGQLLPSAGCACHNNGQGFCLFLGDTSVPTPPDFKLWSCSCLVVTLQSRH